MSRNMLHHNCTFSLILLKCKTQNLVLVGVETNDHAIVFSDPVDLWVNKDSLSINALRACVYIYIRQLSSFRAPRSGCRYLPYSITLSEFMPFVCLFVCLFACMFVYSEDTKILSYDTKMAANGF